MTVQPSTVDPGQQLDEPKLAHVVLRKEIPAAYVEGTPLQALCGVVFVPSRDPEACPKCEPCQVILARIRSRGAN